jgi:hypothetical protein
MKPQQDLGAFRRKLQRRHVARTILALAATAVAGCEAAPVPPNTSRDSLGVTIVESVAPLWGAPDAWRIEEEPILDLAETGSGETHAFFRVRDVLRAGSGDLAVADGASQQVRIYDATGRFLRAFGGPGEGPGEFRSLWTIVPRSDGRLVALDRAAGGSGAEFDPGSGLVSSFRMPEGVSPVRHPVPSDVVWGMDLASGADEERRRAGVQRPPVTIVRLSEDRMSSDSVTSLPGYENFIITEGDDIPIMGRLPHAVPDGEGGIALGTADALEYSIVDGRTGELRLIARIPGVPLTVSSAELDREREEWLGPDPSPFIRDMMARLPVPAEKPGYQRLIVDAGGNVWAGEYLGLARRNEAQEWYVLDSSGVWLGVVDTPARFELMRVDADAVFGVRRDANDVEHPQVLRLVKP